MVAWDTLMLGGGKYEPFDGDFLLAWGARHTPLIVYEVLLALLYI